MNEQLLIVYDLLYFVTVWPQACIMALQSHVLEKFWHFKPLGYHYIWHQIYLSCFNLVIDFKSLNSPQSFPKVAHLSWSEWVGGLTMWGSSIVRLVMADTWAGVIGLAIRMVVVPCGPSAGFVPKFCESGIIKVVGGSNIVDCWLDAPSPDYIHRSYSSKLVIRAILFLMSFKIFW